jgi:hypothetical protein
VRAQLGKFYDANFHLLDVEVALPLVADNASQAARLSLLRRFAVPDVLVRDTIAGEQRAPRPAEPLVPSDASVGPEEVSGEARLAKTRPRDYFRRASLVNWLADGVHLAIIGEPGSGKSTLLRCIALDLLTEQRVFLQIARRWGASCRSTFPFRDGADLARRWAGGPG